MFSFFSDLLSSLTCVVTEMLLAILSICSQEELDSESDGEGEEEAQEEEEAEAIAARRQAIKNKIMAVGRVQKMFQIFRFVFFFWVLVILLI